MDQNSCIAFLLNCLANQSVEQSTRTTFWNNFIKHIKLEITGTAKPKTYNLFSPTSADRIDELNHILEKFAALIRYEFGSRIQNDLAIELIFFIEDIVR